MDALRTTVLVIGGGPGGYVAAIKAGQLGLDTILIEEERLGGTCLNVGCIPSKALIHAADLFHEITDTARLGAIGISVATPRIDLAKTIAWKDEIVGRLNRGVAGLLSKNKVKVLTGKAELLDGKTVLVHTAAGQQRVRTEHLVIATGAAPVEIASLPFGGRVMSSTEMLSLQEVPKSLVVVGAGYIGLELGIAYAKLGAGVTVVEAAEALLPAYDRELTQPVARRLEALGITLLTGARAAGLSSAGDALLVRRADGSDASLPADVILVAVGRRPRTEGFGLERLSLTMNGGFIAIDERCSTSMRNVWAIGDVTGEPMLAHRAMAQGEMVAEIIAGHRRVADWRCIPAVCFTDPEIVTAGLSPQEAEASGVTVKVGLFPFKASGRAMSRMGEDGFVRVVARADNGLLLGIQAVGQGVSELSAAFGLALEMGATLEDVAGTIHAHPTLGEALQEAALKALGGALHI